MGCALSRSNFDSSNGTDRIAYYLFWEEHPARPPKAILQISHGMCEYLLRYSDFARTCTSQGYIVCGNDHLGHGASVSSDDRLGYFAPEHGWNYLVQDVHRLTLKMKEQYPGLPVVLLGHSMGSLVVRVYLKQYDDTIAGLIVCGSPSKTPASKVGLALCRALITRYGDRHPGKKFHRIAFGAFNRQFPDAQTENDWLCSRREVVDAYESDPDCGFYFTMNGFQALFHLLEETYDPKGWQVQQPDLPIWFISGEQDACLNDWEHFLEAVDFLRQVGYTNVTCHLYPEMRHEILNEANREKVFQDIAQHLEDWRKLLPEKTEK